MPGGTHEVTSVSGHCAQHAPCAIMHEAPLGLPALTAGRHVAGFSQTMPEADTEIPGAAHHSNFRRRLP